MKVKAVKAERTMIGPGTRRSSCVMSLKGVFVVEHEVMVRTGAPTPTHSLQWVEDIVIQLDAPVLV